MFEKIEQGDLIPAPSRWRRRPTFDGGKITRLNTYREGSKFSIGDGADSYLREGI